MKRALAALSCLLLAVLTACQPESAKPRVAVIPKGMAHQFWVTVKTGAEAAGRDLDVDVVWNGPDKETQIEKQINIFENMLAMGVNAVVLAACDENALNGPVDRAVARGIPIVTIDSGVTTNSPLSFVATDNEAGAEIAADTLVALIGGSGKVGLIPFVSGAATSEMRERGFRRGLAKHPEAVLAAVQYSQSDEATGMRVTEDMLTANPDIEGIFAANEAGCIGAARAIVGHGAAGRVRLVCFDAAEEQITALIEGVADALIVQNPYMMGYEGVRAAVMAMNGETVPERIDTGVTVVTRDNLNTPEVQRLLYPTRQ
jgi:ribose transport system substrate-binding protein